MVALRAGDKVMIKDKAVCFRLCTVKTLKDGQALCFDESYTSYEVPMAECLPVNPDSTNAVEDNTELMHLHDASLLHNIRQRYEKDQIYTYTANILIAVNPYQNLGLYNDNAIKTYYGSTLRAHAPHIYALANRAFMQMKSSKIKQSMVVSGESGAGKTETCKHIMQFLTSVGGDGVGSMDVLEKKILDANPVLEAFGNAKTMRNNNSSRFGKYTEIHFDVSSGNPRVSGAKIDTYLLEKSRLVSHVSGERGFHVFNQLASSGAVKLGPSNEYSYLVGSPDGEIGTIDGVDDKSEFKKLEASMSSLGFSKAEISECWQILGGLLELGNVEPLPERSTVSVAAKPTKSSALSQAAAYLGLSHSLLMERLTNRTIKAGASESVVVALPVDEANGARDALAKFIYGKMFDWIVTKINSFVPGKNGATFIGILDISGFEIFDTNSFEQFTINFANEKIQQYFNWQILKQEQEIYELEGLRYRQVEFEDNMLLIDLIESKTCGILGLLDEACLAPRANDETFVISVHTQHTANKYLSKPKHTRSSKKRLLDREAFVVNHFAGDVCYEVKSFLEKNNDTIHDELIELIGSSNVPLVKALFPMAKAEKASYGPTGGRFKSVSAVFKEQLEILMGTLRETNSHFVRCIKPNGTQSPRSFENNSVMMQLRYSGMCAALLLMQAGFPTRISFQELHSRYASKMPAILQKLKPITFCEALLVALDLHGGSDYQMGLTKVFFRPGKLAIMDQLTLDSSENTEVVIQKVRKWLAKKRFHDAAHAIVAVNRMGKMLQGIRSFRRFRQAANVMLRVARYAKPALEQVRKRLYSEEVMRKRREEEMERKRIELEQQKAREAEAELKRHAELARIKKEEEEKRRIAEEAERARAAALKTLEDRVMELSQTNAELSAKLSAATTTSKSVSKMLNEVQVELSTERTAKAELAETVRVSIEERVALQERLETERQTMEAQLKKVSDSAAGDQAQIAAELTVTVQAKQEVEQKLGDALEKVRVEASATTAMTKKCEELEISIATVTEKAQKSKEMLTTELTNTKSELEGKLAALDEALKSEQRISSERQESITQLQTTKAESDTRLQELNALVESLQEQLKNEMDKNVGLSDELHAERHAHEDDNHNYNSQLKDFKKKYTMEVGVKDAVIASLKLDKTNLSAKVALAEEKLSKTTDHYKAECERLNDEIDVANCDRNMLTDQKSRLQADLDAMQNQKDQLALERNNLIEVAIRCQEFQQKLRNIYNNFKKEGDLIELIYGGQSYELMITHNSKAGTVQKQGGANVKKWDTRHLVLVDCFLLYYDSKKAKSPKGVVKMFQSTSDKVDLSGLSKENGFTVIDGSSGREYFFSANDAEDQSSWLTVLAKSQKSA